MDDRTEQIGRRSAAAERPSGGDAVTMFISAAIFGFFGFAYGWVAVPVAQFVMWSLRGASIGFALSGLLTLLGLAVGPMIYAVVSALSVILFLIGGVWMLMVTGGRDLNGYLLLIFALWNGSDLFRRRSRSG